MKTSSTAIKWFSASVFLFASSTVLAECAEFNNLFIMDNTIPSLSGKQCSCVCTINPFTTAMSLKFQTLSGGKPKFVSSCDNQAALKSGPPMPCKEVATSSPATQNPSTLPTKKCYKLGSATALKKGCGCFCTDTPLSGTESIQLGNPIVVTSCSGAGLNSNTNMGSSKICEKKDVLPTTSNTLSPQSAPIMPPK